MLIENGVVNINERDDKGATPAHKGMLSLLYWFLQNFVDIFISDHIITALSLSISDCNTQFPYDKFKLT